VPIRKFLLAALGVLALGAAVLAPAQAPPAAAPAAAAPVVGGPELVFQCAAAAQAGLGAFPDGNLNYRWPPTVGRANPILYGSANGSMARLDIPTTAQKCLPIRGLPGYYRYAAGGGGLVTNPLDGRWLAVIHLERAAPSSPKFFWGNLGLVVSDDFGQSWSWLGVIVEPELRYSDPMHFVGEIGGGAVVWREDYLLCYYRETTAQGRGRAAVAYCNAQEVFRAAKSGRVAPWRKWAGVAFPTDDDPPAVGGGLGAQLAGLPAEEDWCSCAYLADLGYYLKAVCPFADKKIYAYRSTDGLAPWTPLFGGQPVAGAGEDGYQYYPSWVGLNPDERFTTVTKTGTGRNGLWLYYLTSKADPFQWATAECRRRWVSPN
jgi:hypothetical protein